MNAPIREDFAMIGNVFFTSSFVIWSSLSAAFKFDTTAASVLLIRPIICAIAYTPSKTASILIPLYNLIFPNVNLVTPLTESIPTVANKIPSPPLIRPFTRLFPLTDAITESPKIASAKYSGELNFIATLLICGAKNRRQNALTRPPNVDATSAISNALLGCPFLHIG